MMAIDLRPDAASSSVSGPIATVRVVGILSVRLSGGNQHWHWPAWLVDEEVAAFAPGSVPLIDGHNATGRPALIVGSIDELASCREGLRFGGTVTDPAMAERLRYQGAAVSPELKARAGARDTIEYPGAAAAGLLVAVAILSRDEHPARRGSCLWLR